MNPHYLSYCKARGRTLQEQLEHDRATYPGGIMCEFILWMRERHIAYQLAHGADPQGSIEDHEAWGEFLDDPANTDAGGLRPSPT